MHKIPPNISGVRSRLPTAPTEEQLPTENINNTFPDRIIPNKKKYLDSIPQDMKIKQLNSQVKEGIIHLKVFPVAKGNQLIITSFQR